MFKVCMQWNCQEKCSRIARAEHILNNRSLETATHILEQCRSKQIQIMTLQDAVYPEYAKEICEMPVMLYYEGKPREDSIGVAVIGARRCTKQGKERAIELAYCLTRESIPIVSGMVYKSIENSVKRSLKTRSL